jgi:hypothetical protein
VSGNPPTGRRLDKCGEGKTKCGRKKKEQKLKNR